MKNLNTIVSLKILIAFVALIFISCSKDSNEPDQPDTTITVTTQDFSTTMDENPTNGQVIGTVQGSTNQGSVTFSITEQTPAGAFSIDAASGELKVANATLFQYETNPIITGTVKVSNGEVYKTASITITLTFLEKIYEGFVYLSSQEDVNLFGAQNYTKVDGWITIGGPQGATNISDLSPLHSIKSIYGDLEIMNNPILVSTEGLDIAELKSLSISDNQRLEIIEGFNNLTSLEVLYISINNVLSDFSGISQLTNISSFTISDCPLVQNLSWLSNLSSLKNRLDIRRCHGLTNINELINLRTMDGDNPYMFISQNNLLKNIDGLQNLNATLDKLTIFKNPALLNIDGMGSIQVSRTFRISENNLLQNLNGLAAITRCEETAFITENNSLIDLQGLDNMEYCRILYIENNSNLESLNGLEKLEADSTIMNISDNENLTDFCSLHYTDFNNQIFRCHGNAYNPTIYDLIDGNCSL